MDLDLFFPRRQHYWDPIGWPQRWSSVMSDPIDDLLSLALTRDAVQREVERRDTSGQLANDPNKFQVKLDCSHFRPEEIEVKTVDNNVVIHGKHEERTDKHGWVQREFTRRYALPDDCEAKQLKSSLTSNGVLTIEAPKRRPEAIKHNERVVPIRVTHHSSDERQKEIQQN